MRNLTLEERDKYYCRVAKHPNGIRVSGADLLALLNAADERDALAFLLNPNKTVEEVSAAIAKVRSNDARKPADA